MCLTKPSEKSGVPHSVPFVAFSLITLEPP